MLVNFRSFSPVLTLTLTTDWTSNIVRGLSKDALHRIWEGGGESSVRMNLWYVILARTAKLALMNDHPICCRGSFISDRVVSRFLLRESRMKDAGKIGMLRFVI